MENPGIVVVGSLNPEKEIQDRVRVLGVDGICQALRATDYKDPPKILGTIYTDVSEDFQRGLYPIARCVKASAHDLGIVQMQAERREGRRCGLSDAYLFCPQAYGPRVLAADGFFGFRL